MEFLTLKVGKPRPTSVVWGGITLRCGDEYEYWTDFSLTDQENQQIEVIMQNHADEGYSVTFDAYDIADEIKETLR